MNEKIVPKIGFLGFGEAGFNLASGFLSEGISGIKAYDICQSRDKDCQKVIGRATAAGVELVDSPQALAKSVDIIISAVVCAEAVVAAESIAPYLTNQHMYVDINATAPDTKMEVADVLLDSKVKFVDAAVMGPIPNHRHKVPIMVSGTGSESFMQLMTEYGMKLEFVEGGAGSACSVKMLRSVFMKGMAALLIEMLTAAYKFGSHETVVATIDETLTQNTPAELIHRLVAGTAIHATRRVHEMDEVIKTLSSVDVAPIMSIATKNTLQWVESMGLKSVFNGDMPEQYEDVLKAIIERG